jgi:hypothetical protein
MAERVAGQRLRQGEVLEWIAAEAVSEMAVVPEEVPPARGPSDRRESHEPAPSRRARARSLPEEVAALARGLASADAHELDRRLRRVVRLEQTLDAAMAPLLRAVRAADYEWKGEEYRPMRSYAPDALGMSARKARALVRLERAGDVCPELREAYRGGLISWVKAQVLLPLLLLDLDGEWRSRWVSWAAQVTLRRLEADVTRALLLRAGHDRAWHRCKFHPERALDAIPSSERESERERERQLCAPDVDPEATQRLVWRVPVDVALLFTAVLEAARAALRSQRPERGLPTDGEAFDALLDSAMAAWSRRDPGARRADPVIARDGYQCAVPGCTSRRNLQDHHIRFRSAGGSDDLSNRVTLCAFHHQRCLHAGHLRIRGRAPDRLVFELGARPDGPPLARYASGDVAMPLVDPAGARAA